MEGVRERLVALEHEQWAQRTRHMLDNLTPENIERWRRQIDASYAALSEREQGSGQEWAERVFAELRDPLHRVALGYAIWNETVLEKERREEYIGSCWRDNFEAILSCVLEDWGIDQVEIQKEARERVARYFARLMPRRRPKRPPK